MNNISYCSPFTVYDFYDLNDFNDLKDLDDLPKASLWLTKFEEKL